MGSLSHHADPRRTSLSPPPEYAQSGSPWLSHVHRNELRHAPRHTSATREDLRTSTIDERPTVSIAWRSDGATGTTQPRATVTAAGSDPQRLAIVVEDDPVMSDMLAASIRLLGPEWSVTAVMDGASAERLLEQAGLAPELILVDMGLPYVGGLEVIRQARRRFPQLAILVVSSQTSDSVLLDAIRAGAHGYLLKGEPPQVLVQAIADVLDGQYPISPSLARLLFKLAGAPAEPSHTSPTLTPREIELLKALAEGLSYSQCADLMGVALSTVQSHIRNLYRKLEVRTQMQAVSKARRFGILHPDDPR